MRGRGAPRALTGVDTPGWPAIYSAATPATEVEMTLESLALALAAASPLAAATPPGRGRTRVASRPR